MFSFFSKNIKTLSDSELWDRYQKTAEKKYAEELFKRSYHLVYGIALSLVQNTDDAKDAVMAVMESFLKNKEKKPIQNLGAWLHTCTRNYCLNFLKARQRQKIRELMFSEQQPEIDETDYLLKEKQFEQLAKALEELSNSQKLCVELFYFQNKSYREIMKLTGLNEMQVKSNIQNGKRNLKLKMNF